MSTVESRRSRFSARVAMVGAVLAAISLLAGCSGAGGGSTSSVSEGSDSGGSVAADESAALKRADGQRAQGAPKGVGNGVNRPAVQTRAVIRTGTVYVVSQDLGRARAEVGDLLSRYGGYISSENSSNDAKGRPDRSSLVMRFPVSDFDEVMTELGELGRVRSSTSGSDDVTTEVIDVDTRVATQEASLSRLKRFLGQARDIDDIIALESEIATRQAALESLKGQQKYLADQTALSTIELELTTPQSYVEPPPPLDDAGFLAGLSGGWKAMKDVVVVVLTVIGAVLPFAVALALIGVPTWLLLRTSRRRHQLTPAAVQPSPRDAS